MIHLKQHVTSLGAMLTAIAITVFVGACARPTSADNTPQKVEIIKPDRNGITSMELKESMRTANTAYQYTLDGDTCFMTYSAVVEWPEKIGSYDIASLQDSILSAAFGAKPGTGIEDALKEYSSDTTGMSPDARRIDPAGAPISIRAYTSTVTTKAIDTNDRYTTYQVTNSRYTGGAHPMTAITSYTYDYASRQVLTPENLFTAGSDSTVISSIKSTLAAKLNVAPDNLTAAGLFSDSIPMPTNIYVVNNSLVFHYGQYEIAPYSMGMFDINVSPFALRDVLSPAARALFKDNIE